MSAKLRDTGTGASGAASFDDASFENQMVVCGINRVGRDPNVEYPGASVIHDARGEILARGDAAEALVSAEVDFDDVTAWRSQFPALRDRRPEVYAKVGG